MGNHYEPVPDEFPEPGVDAGGWPRCVARTWAYNNDAGWTLDAPDVYLSERGRAPVSQDDVVAVHLGGEWQGPEMLVAAFHTVAEATWPQQLHDRPLDATRLPTWEELVHHLHPDMSSQEIRLWLLVGKTAGSPDGHLSRSPQRVVRWQSSVPEDWLQTVDPGLRIYLVSPEVLMANPNSILVADPRRRFRRTDEPDWVSRLVGVGILGPTTPSDVAEWGRTAAEIAESARRDGAWLESKVCLWETYYDGRPTVEPANAFMRDDSLQWDASWPAPPAADGEPAARESDAAADDLSRWRARASALSAVCSRNGEIAREFADWITGAQFPDRDQVARMRAHVQALRSEVDLLGQLEQRESAGS